MRRVGRSKTKITRLSRGRQLIRTEKALVPGLSWFEVRNKLIINERRKRIAERAVSEFLRRLSSLDVDVDATPGESHMLEPARRHRLTVYDAAYLELARRQAIALATLDHRLADAAKAEQVPLIGS